MEGGLLTSLDSTRMQPDGNDEPPQYDSLGQGASGEATDSKKASLYDACVGALSGSKMKKPLVVFLTAALKPVEVQPWEAASDEQIASFADVPVEQKIIVRMPGESSGKDVQELWNRLRGVLGMLYPPDMWLLD